MIKPLTVLAVLVGATGLLRAQLPGAPTIDFNKHIKPIFSKHCYECHSESRKKEKAGYVFDNLNRLAGSIGENEIIVPKNTSASDLLEIVTMLDGKRAMPPDGKDKLSEKEVMALRTWIEEGANLPGIDIAAKMASEKRARPKQVMNWTNAQGKKLRATFEGMEGENVLLKSEEGTVYKVPMTSLSQGSQIQAQMQAK
ncbi:MAG: c-type cytochrome [Verrucomicrobiaceae bacterium]|nr:c-type cytochrome [Verrucomicrobiaceae bacterium]